MFGPVKRLDLPSMRLVANPTIICPDGIVDAINDAILYAFGR